MQRRLSRAEIEQLTHRYRKGASIDGLASRYEVDWTTVIHHLNHAGSGSSSTRVIPIGTSVTRCRGGAAFEVHDPFARGHQRVIRDE